MSIFPDVLFSVRITVLNSQVENFNTFALADWIGIPFPQRDVHIIAQPDPRP